MMGGDDGDRLLDLGGLVIGVLLLLMLGALVLAFVGAPSGGATGGPPVEWSVERVNDTHVRITHAGGETVSADRLVVSVDGYDRDVTWEGRITEGDSGVVRAGTNRVVTLYWLTEQGERIRLDDWRT
ncbi:MAG: hypothetical protein ABEH78_04795 [Haloferacaceae archaeon]